MPFYGQPICATTLDKGGKKLEAAQKAQILAQMTEAFIKREPYQEREMLKFFFRQMDELPAGQRFAAADSKFGNKKGKERRDAEAAFAEQVATGPLANPQAIVDLTNLSWSELQAQHPFVAGVVDEKAALAARGQKFNANVDRLRLLYQQALAEMRGNSPYADANFTMRFTYGNVQGYQSREAEMRTHLTTLKRMK